MQDTTAGQSRTRDGRTKKRANKEGSIFVRKDRNGKVISYRGVITVSWKEGRQKRQSFSAPTKEAVREWMNRMLVRKQDGMLPNANGLTVGIYLEEWLKHKAKEIRPSTLRGYTQVVENHIKPLLGKERLDKLQPSHVDQLHRAMQGKNLSHRMLEYAHVLLHGALDYAVRLEMLPRNVADVVKLPRKQGRSEIQVWSLQQIRQFLAYLKAQTHPFYPLFYTALATGMRRGELMALKWAEVDLNQAEL